MSYSASDFVETMCTVLNVGGDCEDFAEQADIMVREVERLQKFERDIKHAASVLGNVKDKAKLAEHILNVLTHENTC